MNWSDSMKEVIKSYINGRTVFLVPTLIFIILKLTNQINWNWEYVLLPFLIWLVLLTIIEGLLGIVERIINK